MALGDGTGGGWAAQAQLTSLLQGLAEGRVLALIQQDSAAQAVGLIGSSLLGDPAPVLGPQPAPSQEDARAVERQRQQLQQHWGLVQAAVR
ncbi:HDA10 deacetylase, partial [Polyodon spathula]|nr:HDA10 deacetylase [Polyodon spathula]